MAEKSKGQSLLENAYKLATPDDNKAYYDEFASTYDDDFATALGWHYPQAIASIYRDQATDQDRPIADVGCGTGLVAEALGYAPDDIDGSTFPKRCSPSRITRACIEQQSRLISQVRSPRSRTTTARSFLPVLSRQGIWGRNRLSLCWELPSRVPCSSLG